MIPPFHISTCEIPYAFWKKVFRYGDAPINTLDARYTFARSGDMGSMRFVPTGSDQAAGKHVQNEPVTNLTLYDMLAMANCLSQMEGRTPVYYVAPEFKTHFRNMHIATYTIGREPVEGAPPIHGDPKLEIKPQPRIHVNWAADGYRLPTASEWLAAAGADATGSSEKSDGTDAVGSTKPNANGLFDVAGNVREMVWTYGDVFDPARHDTQTVMGGDFHGDGDPLAAERAASPYGDSPFDGNHNIGLRIVRREPDLQAPRDQEIQTSSWRIRKGCKTRARRTAAPVAKPVLEMVDIPAGEFLYTEANLETKMKMLPFKMARYEVSFAKWEAVRHWGEARGYEFSRHGHMGSMYWYHFAHTPNEPVTFTQWHDVAVWCNALSEMEGKTPFYYTDPAKTKVYRKAWSYRPIKAAGWEIVDKSEEMQKYSPPRNNEPWLFEKWDGDGYRLPTISEFEYAVRGGGGSRFYWGSEGNRDEHAWSIYNSGGTTHEVGARKPNAYGLYDMVGNVWEWTNSAGHPPKSRRVRYDTTHPKCSRFWAWGVKKFQYDVVENPMRLGGSWFWGGVSHWHSAWSFHEMAHGYMPDHGFRVVRCETGSQPADGNFPIVIPDVLAYDVNDYDDLAGQAYRGSIRRDGVHQTTGVARLRGVKWKASLGGPVKSSPVVTGGVVYIGGPTGFHALDAETGAERWKVAVKGGVNSSACVAAGAVYFTGMDGNVYSADARTGQVNWKSKPKGFHGKPLMSGPAAAYGAVLTFVGGSTVGFEVKTGREFWRCTGGHRGRAAVALHRKYMIAGGRAFTLDKAQLLFDSNHLTDWTSDADLISCVVGDRYWGASSGRGGYAFAKLGCGDLAASRTRWSHFIEQHLPQPQRSYSSCSPAVWEGKVYIGVEKGVAYAFDAATGTKLDWEFNAGRNNGLHSPPSVAANSGLIYFGSQSGELFAVDAGTARERWRLKLDGPIETAPWPADGVVYVSCDDGCVYAIH